MKYSSKDIDIIIKAIKDYKIITGIINVYKENEVDYKDLREQLENMTGFSLIREDKESSFQDCYYITTGYIDFYYNNLILTINLEEKTNGKEVYTTYDLPSGIEVINDTGETIINSVNLEELEKIFSDYVYSKIKNYIDKSSDKDLESNFIWYNVIDKNRDYLLENMYESYMETMTNEEIKKEVDKLKIHTSYDLEVMIYLALEIREILYEEKHFYIDIFYEEIKKIYEDFEKHDDANMSLLDSINKYIDENKESIKERFKDAFDTF